MLTKVIMTAASGYGGWGSSCGVVLDPWGCGGGVLFGVIKRGFVAMVAVGDDELFVGHSAGEQADDSRIVDAPDAVQDAVFVGDFGVGWAGALVEDLFDSAGGVGVEHEDLAKMGVGGLEQVQAVAFGLGEGLLMAEDDLVGVFVKFAEGDEAAALLDLVGTRERGSAGSRRRCRVVFLDQDGLFAPGLEVAGGAGVYTSRHARHQRVRAAQG